MAATHEHKVEQAAGEAATQIGAVGGDVIQHVNVKGGFWSWLTASVITIGVLLFSVLVLGGVGMHLGWYADEPVSGFDGGPGMQHDGGAGLQPTPVSYVPHVGGSALPASAYAALSGASDAASQAQVIRMAAQLMGWFNSVEAQSVAARDPYLAATAFRGEALQCLQQHILDLTASGLFHQAVLEGGQVLGVRVVAGDSWTTVLQIDTCEFWSGTTFDASGWIVASEPRHAVPQTVTVEMSGGQAFVTGIDFEVAFPACQ